MASHGSPSAPDNSAGQESQPTEAVSPSRFLRRNTLGATDNDGTAYPRRDSVSSVDTEDLMDHRRSSASFHRASPNVNNSYGPPDRSRPSTFISRRRRSLTNADSPAVPRYRNPFQPEQAPIIESSRRKSFSSPSFIERMVHRRDSSSRTPLLQNQLGYAPNYDSLEAVDRASEALAVDIESLHMHSGNLGARNHSQSGISSSVNARHGLLNERNQHLLDVDEYSDVLGSEIASRRSSVSSLGDVCLPIDSPRAVSSLGGGGNFDLSYLEEFAVNEKKELLELQDSIPAESIFGNDNGQGTVSSMPGVNALTSQKVNEVDLEEGGRLRPHRVVPWGSTTGNKRVNQLKGVKSDPLKKGETKSNSSSLNSYHPVASDMVLPFSPQSDNDATSSSMRFTYFREDLDATIHSPTISGLLQPGQKFDDLFNVLVYGQSGYHTPQYGVGKNLNAAQSVPEFGEMRSEGVNNIGPAVAFSNSIPKNGDTLNETSASHRKTHTKGNPSVASGLSGASTPVSRSRESSMPLAAEETAANTKTGKAQSQQPASENYAMEPSPFWLDVLNPTEEEMKVLSKSFGIHPLTTEDIFLGEPREKVELFRHYYLVCFRSFDIHDERNKQKVQISRTEDAGATKWGESKGSRSRKSKSKQSSELTPLNMYIIVFHEGVITFHFSPTPHPINVRRRARLLRDYITVSSDWISYALIDDITDGFAPMIEAIDDEVNYIEDSILRMHSGDSSDEESDDEDDADSYRTSSASKLSFFKKGARSTSSTSSTVSSNEGKWREKGDMLRRIGECRKRIMSILRLLGSKADVIKGFSKRCNEQWEVAPRSEIGLYLGDIQDHIITMVQSLNHYEKLLARSHSNYLAQINIDMTRVNNDMNDVLSRITVLGTIVLPMNIVTGLWGMNVMVPGQEVESLTWFWSITFSLFVFAFICFFIARRVYDIA